MNVGLFSKKDKLLSDISLTNVEALAKVTIGGVEYMTSQEISDVMNSFSGWFWQEYWTPCYIDLSVKVTKKSGSLTVGTIFKGIDGVATIVSEGSTYTILTGQPGQKKYCPDGSGPCKPQDCK